MQRRIERLRQSLERAELDALWVSADENRRYLSGFTGSAGTLIVSAERAFLLSDFRYQEQSGIEAPDWEFRLVKPPEMPEPALVAAILGELNLRTVGFEAAHLTYARHHEVQHALQSAGVDVELRPTEGLVDELRAIKDAAELASLERAIAITDQAFATIRTLMRPTMRERDVAWELEKAMREAGADALAYPIIVAAGPNGARPHARGGDDQLGLGRPIVMDFGALVDGYRADMTRTVILGEADEQFTRIYTIVKDAQAYAASHVRAGMISRDADALARDRITAAGYGDYFGHGLGHGVGLVIHEEPRLKRDGDKLLPAGSVFSVEPGIYLPGWGGVRVEDLIHLTEDGPRTLTGSTKDPVIPQEA